MSNKMLVNTLVVDLDDTLFIRSFWTYFFFKISRFFHRLALRYERLNKFLAEDIRGAKVIILSGRAMEWEKEFFEQQLKKHRIKYEKIILCPRTEIVMDWKRKELEKIKEEYGSYSWIDDQSNIGE